MSRLSDLYELQETDLEIDSRRAAFDEAESRLGQTEELDAAAAVMEERQAESRELHKKLRSAEQEVDDLEGKIKPLEKKLYGGSVHNPKELAGIEEDVRSIKARKRVLEDRALEVMSEMEAADEVFDAAQKEHAALLAAWDAEQAKLRQEQETLTAEIAQWETKRSQQRKGIDAGMLVLYDALRATHQGRAVAKVERGTCGGCRISLPMSTLHKARAASDAIVQCSSCERILYVS